MTQRRNAFSLMELLVVIAIMVLLIGFVQSSLRKARESASAISCETNLRQMMSATITYCGDWNDKLPHSNWGGNAVDVNWNHGGWLYWNESRQALTQDSQWNIDLLQSGDLWPYINDADVFRCVRDLKPWLPKAGQLTTYCMNGSVNGYGRSGESSTFQLAHFRPNDLLYWEVDRYGSDGWWWDGGNYPHEGLSSVLHLKGGCLANADGHTEWWHQDTYYKELNFSPGRLWNVPDSSNGH